MKKKIKRLDKKDTAEIENSVMVDSVSSSEDTSEENVKKGPTIALVDLIALGLVAIVLFLGLLSSSLAAEGLFGDPDEWHWQDSRMMMYMALAVAVGIFYLASKIEEKIKKWKNKKH